ncbi:MAG: ATP-binding protein, partial [Chloroflexi bacterium]|nr:ATP-binding protein [Chloroflexota bacterium]
MKPDSGLINPYRFGRPIEDPNCFFGREQQLRDIRECVIKCECVNIVGERRSGKTSLMYQISHPHIWNRYIGDPNCLPIYLDAEIIPQDEEGFFREVFRKVKELDPD